MTFVARQSPARASLRRRIPSACARSARRKQSRGSRRDELAAFRDRHLVARNGVIAVFGEVKADGSARAGRGSARRICPPANLRLTHLPQPAPLAARAGIERSKTKQQAVLMVGYPRRRYVQPGSRRARTHRRSVQRSRLAAVPAHSRRDGPRLFRRQQQLLGLARGAFTFYLGTDPAKLTEVKAALHDEIAKLAEDGLTAEEFARAKEKMLGQQEIRNQSNDAFAFPCALDELYGLGFDHYRSSARRSKRVTLDEVRARRAQILPGSPRSPRSCGRRDRQEGRRGYGASTRRTSPRPRKARASSSRKPPRPRCSRDRRRADAPA